MLLIGKCSRADTYSPQLRWSGTQLRSHRNSKDYPWKSSEYLNILFIVEGQKVIRTRPKSAGPDIRRSNMCFILMRSTSWLQNAAPYARRATRDERRMRHPAGTGKPGENLIRKQTAERKSHEASDGHRETWEQPELTANGGTRKPCGIRRVPGNLEAT